MAKRKKAVGFCPMCMQNVEHSRKPTSTPIMLINLVSLGLLRLSRFGPWQCFQCERQSYYLKYANRNAPTFSRQQSRSEFGRPKNADALDETPNASPDSVVESVGNYLKSDHSLVMKDKRAKRFSQKFRDSTVERILAGGATIAQIRNELDVSESDIISWIENVVSRKDELIDELNLTLQQIQSNLPKHLGEAVEAVRKESSHHSDVVEGRILPK